MKTEDVTERAIVAVPRVHAAMAAGESRSQAHPEGMSLF